MFPTPSWSAVRRKAGYAGPGHLSDMKGNQVNLLFCMALRRYVAFVHVKVVVKIAILTNCRKANLFCVIISMHAASWLRSSVSLSLHDPLKSYCKKG